ncbi:voltage-gated potassium channel [Leifsonia sp. 98AMF]|uniref:potassium channel family protein n=1 Tax=unclassified Leifsonia TaxID=2663824 RepID=UPI00087A8D1A|nr:MULTISPECIES: potassium channel family protein [unclassified Leifsonia]SDH33120.1 voltage-gated potassium channel [Leifsonia sp. 197AMF]SDJ01865.1 voltage-gated potassium channel [Leifsonia sp. 466MF]SDJ71550.1 voltage-gated potassium channel [Leifsonia sp. 157MF]SDO05574.1 voltage-gated potassium channel [Leifsonia sp. 509MF]SEM98468.1 voltage-gated potassium channel [Leifsonia sp. 467MF]
MTLERWRTIADWPLTAAAFLFLIAYAWEVIGDLAGSASAVAEAVIAVTWTAFVIDYVVCLVLAPRRWRWFYTHLLDLAIVVLPALRPLRLLRLVTVLAVLQRTAGRAFRGRVIMYVAGAVALLVFTAALAVLDAERSAPASPIHTFPQAVWWAFETISTVGYGDFTPITETGRLVAVGLMVGGVATLGIVTATLASWIVERVAETEADERAATHGEIVALSAQIAELRELLEEKAA